MLGSTVLMSQAFHFHSPGPRRPGQPTAGSWSSGDGVGVVRTGGNLVSRRVLLPFLAATMVFAATFGAPSAAAAPLPPTDGAGSTGSAIAIQAWRSTLAQLGITVKTRLVRSTVAGRPVTPARHARRGGPGSVVARRVRRAGHHDGPVLRRRAAGVVPAAAVHGPPAGHRLTWTKRQLSDGNVRVRHRRLPLSRIVLRISAPSRFR